MSDIVPVHHLDRRCSPVFAHASGYARLLEGSGLLLVVREHRELMAFVAWDCVIDEASLLNITVSSDHRQRGIARALVDRSVTELTLRGVRRLHLEVRESNVAAIALYRSRGFEVLGRRAAYYAAAPGETREDALVMRRDVADGERPRSVD